MAAQASRVTDDRYLNWIKDTLALIYLKEGLEVFLDYQTSTFHKQLKAALGNQSCNNCSWQDLAKKHGRWKVNCNVCQQWLNRIVSHHTNCPLPIFATKNTDPKLWTTHAWEVIKLYQSKGCQGQHSAKDTDVAGILTVIGNCDHFHSFINDINLVHELQCIRNKTMHSSDFLVETVDLARDLQIMLQFLRDLKSLSAAEQRSVNTAIDKIDELRLAKLDVCLNREIELKALNAKLGVYEIRINNIEGLEDTMDKEVQLLSQRQCSLLNMINDIQKEMTTQQSTESIRTSLISLQQHYNFIEESLSNIDEAIVRQSNHMKEHSDQLKEQGEHIQEHEDYIKEHGDHITTLYKRQKDAKMVRQAHVDQLADHKGRLETLESHHNQAVNENKEINDDDITALQSFLRNYYRSMCLTIPNPLVSEELRLDCLYVQLDINVLRQTTDPGCGLVTVKDQQRPANVSQFRTLFYTEDYKCRQIYITGDAGIGKSTFCKHLVDLWCKTDSEIVTNTEFSSKNNENSDPDKGTCKQKRMKESMSIPSDIEKDKRIMSEFKLLFYLTLRESSNQYHVEDMIDSQILQQNKETQHLKASVLLQRVPCLVVVDGLDEWACPSNAKVPRFVKPGIPGRDWLNQRNVFLTTTRSWKLDVLQLTSKEIDKHVELVGFNTISSETLCSKVIELLEKAESVQRTEGQFMAELQEKGLSDLCVIPVLLTQLICLWFDKQDIGKSQVQLYCSMFDMLLKRAGKNLTEQTCTFKPEAVHQKMIYDFFSNRPHCQAHLHLLVSLCKLAFEALFSQKREQALVFESSEMQILGLEKTHIDLCLKSGILSQSKLLGKWSKSEKKMSFLHKKLQEFLAAVYIAYNENSESVMSHVKKSCVTEGRMLEMSQVWIFVSGIRPESANQVLTDLMTDVVIDRHVLSHERYLTAELIQKFIVNCVVEARNNDHLDFCLPLDDFVIQRSTISACLERLLIFNEAAIKYVYINTYGIAQAKVKEIMCYLQNTKCLQKLDINDFNMVTTYLKPWRQILNNSNNLKSLRLRFTGLSTTTSATVCGVLNHVTALHLFDVTLTHTQIKQLMLSVSRARELRQLVLLRFFCRLHGRQCKPAIDLSSLKHLNILHLAFMYVKHLPKMVYSMKRVELYCVTLAEDQLRQLVHKLSSNSHKMTVKLLFVTFIGDSENRVDLTDLKHNNEVVVTLCQYDRFDKSWSLDFHTE